MKALTAIGLATAISISAVSPAAARQGCGLGFHRNFRGFCVPNVRQQVWVVGRYYPGRGYWYSGRWWHRRYRDRDDNWRYRDPYDRHHR